MAADCGCEVYEICPGCAPTPEAYERALAASNAAAKRQQEKLDQEAQCCGKGPYND
jgi:hypothetical protein